MHSRCLWSPAPPANFPGNAISRTPARTSLGAGSTALLLTSSERPSLPQCLLRGFLSSQVKLPEMKIGRAVPLLLVVSAQPAFASKYPDLTLILWGYPLLVSFLSSLFTSLHLKARGRRTSSYWLLGAVGVSTFLGQASAAVCLDMTGDFVGALLLWTAGIAACSGVGTFFGSSSPPLQTTAEPDDIGPSKSA